MSLDGYIAGPRGEFDWIPADPDFNFGALAEQFDTIVAGRRTFEPMAVAGRTSMPGMKTMVVSGSLRQEDYPEVVIVPGIAPLAELKASPGKDIWLFGGGKLFRSLAEAGLVGYGGSFGDADSAGGAACRPLRIWRSAFLCRS
jgi:dihydrofolate reductase